MNRLRRDRQGEHHSTFGHRLRARARTLWRLGIPEPRHASPKRIRDRVKTIAAALGVASVVAGAGVAVAALPAQAAASHGVGGDWSRYGSYVGNYTANDGTGRKIICVDPGVDSIGSGGSGTVIDSLSPADGTRAVSGDDLKRLNYLTSTWVQTDNPYQAAAANLNGWNITSANHHGDGIWYLASDAPSQIRDLYWQIRADVEANFNAGVTAGSGQLTFNVDHTNNYAGTATWTSPVPGAVATISLTNGVFLDTGLPTRDGVTSGQTLAIKGTPPDGDATYKISGEWSARGNGGTVYDANVTIYGDEAQRTAGPGTSRPGVVNFNGSAIDPMTRSTVFQPVVGTRVASTFIEKGQPFQDVLVFSTAADATGMNNPWRQALSGKYFPITAVGTLYGPFAQQPGESDEPPVGAPVAAHATVTTTPEDGPTIEYTATGDANSDESGFYTWQWSIQRADQLTTAPNVQLSLPDPYDYRDRFGQVVETSIVPSDITFGTQLDSKEEVIGGDVVDTITPQLIGGAWLRVDGSRVPVTLTGTAYYSETEPVRAAAAPEGAEIVSTHPATLTGPSAITADPITMPYRTGYVTIQWCIDSESTGGLVNAWCDDYGVPSETVKVVGPTITTKAQPDAVPGGTVHDTAIIEGPMPPTGLEVTFEGYLQPADATEPVCTADTAIYTSTEPVLAEETGEYDSEAFPVIEEHLGTVLWVETAKIPGTDIVIHTGKCGEPTETTTVRYPTVTTKALPEVTLGEPAHDVAIVDGATVPGSYVTFTAYLQPEGSKAPVCTPENAVPASTKLPRVPVDGSGEYPSGDVVFDKVGTYMWIEVGHLPDGEVFHTGECGAPGETTVVKAAPALAHTGLSGALPLMIAGGLLLSGALVITALQVRRRRQVEAE